MKNKTVKRVKVDEWAIIQKHLKKHAREYGHHLWIDDNELRYVPEIRQRHLENLAADIGRKLLEDGMIRVSTEKEEFKMGEHLYLRLMVYLPYQVKAPRGKRT